MSNRYINGKIRIIVTFLCLFSTDCGRVKRLIGGMDVDCGSQLRVASLRNSTTLQHLCGATVLSPRFALTAAHCVHSSPDQYRMRLNNFCEDTPTAEVLEIYTHQLYNKRLRAHDIALLRISLDLDDITWLDDSVLPNSSFGISGECTIFGYGSKDPVTIEASEKLLAADVRIASLDWCSSILGPIAPEYDGGMMCAVGDDGADACQGDSGSPLVCNSLVEAISSYGLSCGVAGVPGVYTSVGAHLPWIRGIVHNKRP